MLLAAHHAAKEAKNKKERELNHDKVNTLSLFGLGQIVATPGALLALEKAGQSPGEFLARHHSGDWGDLEEEDRQENARSLEHGFRLLSAYKTVAGEKLWVITEADRSVTTLLFRASTKNLFREKGESHEHSN